MNEGNPSSLLHIRGSCIPISGERFVIENDGLVIQDVEKTDSGTYTCRARVPETGELEERDIQLEVYTVRHNKHQNIETTVRLFKHLLCKSATIKMVKYKSLS